MLNGGPVLMGFRKARPCSWRGYEAGVQVTYHKSKLLTVTSLPPPHKMSTFYGSHQVVQSMVYQNYQVDATLPVLLQCTIEFESTDILVPGVSG